MALSNDDRFRITFLGAAGTVTGSMHLLEVGERSLLIDCGLYQGRRAESRKRNRELPRRATEVDAVLLTHAHIDHSGNLPNLVRRGFKGPIHATAATMELCQAMLMDSARIHMHDAAWLNRKNRDNPSWDPIEPLYDERDAAEALDRFRPHGYGDVYEPFEGVRVHHIDAGHVLGSSSVIVDVDCGAHRRRVVFSGDIGRNNMPILRDPEVPRHADYVVMESTYGDRLHAPVARMDDDLLAAVKAARAREGKVIIPSFSLERTQEIVFALNRLLKRGAMKPIPVYVDSPLSTNLTEVFRRHPECYDAETRAFDTRHGDPFGFDMLTLITSVEESKALNAVNHPCLIISASGMCEGGRVVHHLRNSIEDPRNMVLIVGYQAQHTLGRRIVERRDRVRIFGVERELRAEVRVLNSFSAHADRDDLLSWADGCGRQVRRFFLVHGDPDQSAALGLHMKERGLKFHIPARGDTVDLER